jgi:hypothetical protein
MKDDVKIIKAKAPKRGTIVKDLPTTGKEFAKPVVSVADPKEIRKISRMRGEEQKIPEVIVYQEDTEAPSKKFEPRPRYVSVEERNVEEFMKKKGVKGTEMEIMKQKLLGAKGKEETAKHITEIVREVKEIGKGVKGMKAGERLKEGEGEESALARINREAKALREEDPSLTHREAQRLASSHYREAKVKFKGASSDEDPGKTSAEERMSKPRKEVLVGTGSDGSIEMKPKRKKPIVAPTPKSSSSGTDTETILGRKGITKLGSESEAEFKRINRMSGFKLLAEFQSEFPRARKERSEVEMRHDILKKKGLWGRRPTALKAIVEVERMKKK